MEHVLLRHNLPVARSSFVGRLRDTADLRRLMEMTRAITLCGPGGVGKTRLAVQVARMAAVEFESGVRLVELADVERPDLVVARLAAATEIRPESGRPIEQTVLAALAGQQLLIVLDNCEHLIAECARLADELLGACPRVRLLATSREPLRIPGETVWRVPPLAVPRADVRAPAALRGYEAVALFEERAAAARPGFEVTTANAAAVAELCRAVDGVPLALELSAARIRMMSVGQIVDRLGDRFQVLAAGDRTAPARQRTLRATVDWSYGLLAERERALLRRLAVFTGGWTLQLAEHVCADPEVPDVELLDLFAGLVDKSFVVPESEGPGGPRYRMLETIRDYALERLTASAEEPMLRARICDHLLDLVERWDRAAMTGRFGWDRVMEITAEVTAEHQNILATLKWTAMSGRIEHGLRLATALRAHWLLREEQAEGKAWLDRLLSAGDRSVTPAVRARALACHAEICHTLGAYGEGMRSAEEAVTLGRESGMADVQARALTVLGVSLWQTGDGAKATAMAEEGLEVARAAGEPVIQGMALGALGTIAGQEGKLKQAQRRLDEALTLMRGCGQRWGVASILLGLATLAELRSDLTAARRQYSEALAIVREMGVARERLSCLIGYGRCLAQQGDFPEARQALDEALRDSRGAGQRLHTARILEILASMALRTHAPGKGVRLLAAASSIREPLGRVRSAGSGALLDRLLGQARTMLGADTVTGLWKEGSELDVRDAVDLAFDTSPEEPPAPVQQVQVREAAPGGLLTAREREIAALIAHGLTNRGIAGELVISQATVARHVANILAKLGFGSRAQVAVWAVEQELS